MKILYITNMYPYKEYPYYGIFVKEQIEAIEKIENIDYKIYFIEGYKGKFEYFKSIFLINSLILKWKPDIIHVHYGLSGLFLLFNPFAAKRTIVALHGGDIQQEQGNETSVMLTKYIIKKVASVFVLNDKMLEIVEKINKKVEILRCGVDTSFFKCDGHKKNYNKKLLIFPGNSQRPVKNFGLFNDVFTDLRKQFSNIDLEFKEIHSLSRGEVNELLCKADCLLMTSISEGSPQIIKEAMACGLPIVSVDVGDVKDLLNEVENSYVSKSFEIKELLGLVEKVLTNEQDRSNGRNGLLAMGLDNDLIAKKIVKRYKEIIKDRQMA